MTSPDAPWPTFRLSLPDGLQAMLRQANEAITATVLTDSTRASIAAVTLGMTKFSTPQLNDVLETIRAEQMKQSGVYETIRRQVLVSQPDTVATLIAAHREVTQGLWGLSELANQRTLVEFAIEGQRAAMRVGEQAAGIVQWARRIYPANWPTNRQLLKRGITIAVDDGIVMAWVPSGQPLMRLFSVPDTAIRLDVLRHYRRKIIGDCEAALGATTMDNDDPHVLALLEAIAVFKRGHLMAAQALAANIIDSWSRELHPSEGQRRNGGKTTANIVKDKTERWQDSNLGVPAILVYAGLHHALGDFWPGAATEPVGFNRNVTAHKLRSDQYTVAHAVQSIMTATALLIATHEGHLTSTSSRWKTA